MYIIKNIFFCKKDMCANLKFSKFSTDTNPEMLEMSVIAGNRYLGQGLFLQINFYKIIYIQ